MFLASVAFCGGVASLQLLPALPSAAIQGLCLLAAMLGRRSTPLLAAALCGFAWAASLVSVQVARDWPCARDGAKVALVGHVVGPAIARVGRTDFDFDVHRPYPFRARLAWYDAAVVPRPGDGWALTAKLRCRRGLANEGAADRELGLLRQGISATGYVLAAAAPRRLPAADRPAIIERLRRQVAAGIAQALPPGPSVAVLQGLAVGVRGHIPDELWDAFAATGVAHLMAISGLHVTGCALFTLFLLRGLRRLPGLRGLPHWPAIQSVAVVSITAAYAWLAGAAAPALRTLAMVAIAVVLRHSRRHWRWHEALACAALCLVGADPMAVTSAGFWLSFAATATLFAMATEAIDWPGRLAAFARAQAAILATLAPILVAAFGRLSLVAPVANAVAIPVFSLLLLPAVLLGTVLELGEEGRAAPIWRALATLLNAAWPALLALARAPFADWLPALPSFALLAAASAATCLAVWLPLPGLRAAAAALLIAMLAGSPPRPAGAAWSLTVVDVGQGLSAVVEAGGRVLVFDTGPGWRGGGAAAEVSLLPTLRSRGIRRIDRLIISHADHDHAGGAAALASRLPVAGAPACRRGEGWRWAGVTFRILHPPAGWSASDNDASCALHVASAYGSALLLADLEAPGESMLATVVYASDVVLLPHHGSRSSSSPALVAAAGARLGIASAGFGNRWGMPHAEVVARWRAAGTSVLTTARDGAITVRFGPQPAVATARAAPRWWRPGDRS